jgi:DNA replication protein DnaC
VSRLEYERLHHNLKFLDPITFESILDNYLEMATKDSKFTIEILDYLIDQEMKSKDVKSLAMRTRLAGFPSPKNVKGFDFGFQPSLDKSVIRELTCLRFIKNAENIVFLGPPGVSKTHLAIALGLEAVRSGFKVHFTNAANLVERLVNADKQDKLEEKIKGLSKFQLLVIDEIGYLPFTVDGAYAFFQLISRFYETSYHLHFQQILWRMGRDLQGSRYRSGYSGQGSPSLHHGKHKGRQLPAQGTKAPGIDTSEFLWMSREKNAYAQGKLLR